MEYYKAIANRKCLCILAGIYVIVIVAFFKTDLRVNANNIADTKEYLSTYSDTIYNIISESNELEAFSIFNKEDSFARKNIEKTKSDFGIIKDTDVKELSGDYLTHYFGYTRMKFWMLVASICISIIFMDNKSKPLKCLLHSCINGKAMMSFRRMMAMFSFIAIYSFLLRAGIMFVAINCFGGYIMKDISYPIQSIQYFCHLTCRFSIGQFIIVEYLQNLLSCFLVALIIWSIFWVCNNYIIALAGTFSLGLAEYILYKIIDQGQTFEILHFCNIVYSCLDEEFWSKYKNLNVFNHPVSVISLNIIISILIILFILVAVILITHIQYPIGSGLRVSGQGFRIIINQTDNFISAVQEHAGIIGTEFYKLIFSQKGLLIIIASIWLLLYFNPISEIKFMGFQEQYNSFIASNEKPLNVTTYEELDSIKAEISDENERYEECLKLYDAGKISKEEILKSQLIHDGLRYKEELYEVVLEQTNYLEKINKEQRVKGWYINSYAYSMLFQDESWINIILLILFISLCCSACVNFEKKNRMFKVIHSTYRGRGEMIRNKIFVTGITVALFYFILVLLRILSVYKSYGISGLKAPAQSFYKLEGLIVPMDMFTYIVLFWGMRLLIILCYSSISILVNLNFNSQLAAVMTVFLGVVGAFLIRKTDVYIFALFLFVGTVFGGIMLQKRWLKSYEIRD